MLKAGEACTKKGNDVMISVIAMEKAMALWVFRPVPYLIVVSVDRFIKRCF